MEEKIYITLGYDLATGDVNLNEIVYRLKELRDRLMLRILEKILKSYDDLIAERLTRTDIYPSKKRKVWVDTYERIGAFLRQCLKSEINYTTSRNLVKIND